MTLRARLTLVYSLLLAISLTLFGVVLYLIMRQSLEAEMDRRLQVRASQVQLTIWPDTQSLTPADLTLASLDLTPLVELDLPGVYVQVLDRDGQVVATSESLHGVALPSDPEGFGEALAGRPVFGNVVIEGNRAIRTLSLPIRVNDKIVGILEVGHSRQTLMETMDNLRTVLLLLGGATLILSGAVGWVVARRGLQPLSTMADRAGEIAAGRDFGRRLDLGDRPDEVGRLAATIDVLLATVDETLRMHREFVADTSHELRNPLLATRTNLELLDRVNDPEDRAECLQEARIQVERMSRLVDDLLVLARDESHQVVERQPVALRPMLHEVLRTAQSRAEGRHLTVDAPTDLEVLGDAGRLSQVLANLVDNALRCTAPDGRITLRLTREGDWARVNVTDDGEGIPAEHLPRHFDRSYRVEKARSRAAGGSGLGLAIVKHLVEAHGGRVGVASRPGQGSTFSLWLPRHAKSRQAADETSPVAGPAGSSNPHSGLITRS